MPSKHLSSIAATEAPATFLATRVFAEQEIRPFAKDWDAEAAFPRDLFTKAGAIGLLGLRLPVTIGGQGKTWWDTAAYIEGLSYGDSGGAVMGLLTQSELTLPLLLAHCSPQLQASLVAPAIRGELVLGLALSEPQAGSDLSMVACRATKSDATYTMDGEKRWITNGGIADALILAARTGERPHDLSLFAFPTATPGFSVVETIEKIGNLSANTAHLRFTNARVPEENRLGVIDGGFRLIMHNFDSERLVMAIYVTACMGRALEAATAYTKSRQAFGRPIIDFQVWRHRFADHLSTYSAARALVREAIAAACQGEADTQLVTAAKLFCTQAAVRVIDDCLQSFGGLGYTPDCAVSRLWRDVRLYTIGGGSSEIMREILSRSL